MYTYTYMAVRPLALFLYHKNTYTTSALCVKLCCFFSNHGVLVLLNTAEFADIC